jgi:hypothetical protein
MRLDKSPRTRRNHPDLIARAFKKPRRRRGHPAQLAEHVATDALDDGKKPAAIHATISHRHHAGMSVIVLSGAKAKRNQHIAAPAQRDDRAAGTSGGCFEVEV